MNWKTSVGRMMGSGEGPTAFIRLDPSRLQFFPQPCDLCGCRNSRPIHSFNLAGFQIGFSRCQECGLIFQHPQLALESRKHVYESVDYWSIRQVPDDQRIDPSMINYYSYLDEEPSRRLNARSRVAWMRRHLPPGARIMDVGCSDGVFVDEMSKFGYDACGIDISNSLVAYGRATHGANIRVADFEEDWGECGQFDAITCFAAISNMVRPSRVFANISRHLKEGGQFFFNFADNDRLLSRLLGRRFYVYRLTVGTIYTFPTIEKYCSNNGLRITEYHTDRQIIPLARAAGLAGFDSIVALLRFLGIDRLTISTPLFTGYMARAIKSPAKFT